MFNLLVALGVLGLWALLDWKTGSVYNVLLILPVIPLPFLDFGLFLTALGMFGVCLLMHFGLREIGFADVIAIPYTMFYVFLAGLPLMAAFPIFLWAFLIQTTRKKKGLIKTCYIRFIPLLFWSFVLSAMAHVLLITTGYFFLTEPITWTFAW